MAILDTYTNVVDVWGASPDVSEHEILAVKQGHATPDVNIQLQNLVRPNTTGGPHLYPMSLTSSDVTVVTQTIIDNDVYTDLITRWDAVAATANGLIVTKATLSTQTTRSVDIYSYTVEPAGWTHTVIVTAGTHGTEKGGAMVLMEFARALIQDTDPAIRAVRGNTRFIFVPCVNPDGYTLDQRANDASFTAGADVDINRNWGDATPTISYVPTAWADYDDGGDATRFKGLSEFSEPETTSLKDLIDGASGLTAVINCHDLGNDVGGKDAIFYNAFSRNQGVTSEGFYAADAALDLSTIDFSVEDAETVVNPTMSYYCQSAGLWAGTLEFNLATYDITTGADMAKVVNYYGNLLVAVALKPSYAHSKMISPRSFVIRKRNTITLSGAQSTYADITDLTTTVPVDFQGIAYYTGTFTVDAGDLAAEDLYLAPKFGQDVSFFGKGDTDNRGAEEKYYVHGVVNVEARTTITITAVRNIYVSARNSAAGSDPLTIGVQYKVLTSTEAPRILRSQINVLLVPTFAGDATTVIDSTDSSLEQVYP